METMGIQTKEHYDLLHQFEQEYKHLRLDKEDKQLWSKGIIYQNGAANDLFDAYRKGYAFGRFMGSH